MLIINKIIKFLYFLTLTIIFSSATTVIASADTIISKSGYELNKTTKYSNGSKYNNKMASGNQGYRKMTPTKTLTTKAIAYNPDNLREVSNLSKKQISEILEGTDLQVLADSYYDMERKYNVNAFFLMALNIEESGYGTSTLAQEKNNLGGVRARDGQWQSFDDWEHSLEYIASLVDEMYLNENGPYYNGLSIYAVNVKYCTGDKWANNLNTIAYELMEKVDNR